MKVINIHKRIINQPKENVSKLLETLSTKDDKIWPNKKWPAIKFKEGLKVGSFGGHGSIRYKIVSYDIGNSIYFEFIKSSGFIGFHSFEIKELEINVIEVKHTIEMNTTGKGIFNWAIVIRWLHDALIEDALDNIENCFSDKNKTTEWSFWVKTLRFFLKPKRNK